MKVLILLIFMISLIFIYIFLINKTNIEVIITNNIKNQLIKEKTSIKEKLVNNTLYQIDSIKKAPIKDPIKEIINVLINKDSIIYIYNTHDTEEYYEPISNGYSITPNVKIASYILKDHLNDLDIQSTVENRKIKDYFTHVSNNSKNDLACEIIIELGNKKYWDTKDLNFKKKMTNVFKEQVIDLENLVPNFKIASAIIKYAIIVINDGSNPALVTSPIKLNAGNIATATTIVGIK